MPNKKCMYEGCDAPEHRKSGYCIRHTESGPRSILINTSKFVNEEPSDEVKVEFVGEEENEEEDDDASVLAGLDPGSKQYKKLSQKIAKKQAREEAAARIASENESKNHSI